MLYWIWFYTLTALGWVFAYIALRKDKKERAGEAADPFPFMVYSFGAMIIALAAGWAVTGIHIYEWIQNALPQQDTIIHTMTTWLISGVLSALWVVHPVFLTLLFDKSKEVAERPR